MIEQTVTSPAQTAEIMHESMFPNLTPADKRTARRIGERVKATGLNKLMDLIKGLDTAATADPYLSSVVSEEGTLTDNAVRAFTGGDTDSYPRILNEVRIQVAERLSGAYIAKALGFHGGNADEIEGLRMHPRFIQMMECTTHSLQKNSSPKMYL